MAIRGFASRMVGKTFTRLTVAADNTPADGQGLNVRSIEAVAFIVEVGPGGSQGTLNVTFQHADTADVNANYAAVPNAQIGAPREETVLPVAGVIALTSATVGFKRYGYMGNKAFVRAIISGTAATPNFSIATGAVGTRRRHIGGT